MAACAIRARCGSRPSCWPSSTRWCRWHRSTSRTTSPRSGWRCASNPTCRRWPALTPRSTAALPRSNRRLPCPIRCSRRGCGATAFMGCPMNTSPRRCAFARRNWRMAGWWWRISAIPARERAIKAGVSVATTMGFTALDGLPMGTRCGELDPGVVLHLIQQKKMSAEALVDLLYRRSGMVGLSGVSSDFRELLASSDPRAKFAVELFCYRVARHVASLAAALGGLDAVVFTAGVGENAAPVRAAICRACAWLGLDLDEAANRDHRPWISTPSSRVKALVIATDENLMIARHTRAVIAL